MGLTTPASMETLQGVRLTCGPQRLLSLFNENASQDWSRLTIQWPVTVSFHVHDKMALLNSNNAKLDKFMLLPRLLFDRKVAVGLQGRCP